MRKKLGILAGVLVLTCLPLSILYAQDTALNSLSAKPVKLVKTLVNQAKDYCQSPLVDKPVYSAEIVSVNVPEKVLPGELFDLNIRYKNTGNQPWFSYDSGCPGQSSTFLGTTRQLDRISPFFASAIFAHDSNWYQSNRINMIQKKVNPGEVADFTFKGLAPQDQGIFREYFAPVVEGKTWIKENEATFDIKVGNPEEDENILRFTRYLDSSINLLDSIFKGEKSIRIILSKQRMELKVGDTVIKNYPVSSGKPKTPTPVGKTKILLKQEVRVAGSYPHYIMPKFMMFRNGGFGIHALPSLANDHGVFWREALNHIGSARSHGCVRLLPQDAEFAYKFTDVGTTVEVVR